MQVPTSTLGSYLKQLRRERNLTQLELSVVTQLHPRTISAIETNRRPGTPEHLERLATGLGVELSALVRHPGKRAFHSPLDEHFRQRNSWHPRSEREGVARLSSVKALCPGLVETLLATVSSRADADCAHSLLSLAATDSGPEWMVLLHRLAAGDYPTSFSPLEVGYRLHPVVDPKTRRSVGDCAVPGVAGEGAGMRFLILPHVGISTPRLYTLDALLIVQARGKRHEIDLEIDGSGHHSAPDARRQREIQMPVLRFTEKQILRADFNAVFLTELSTLCHR